MGGEGIFVESTENLFKSTSFKKLYEVIMHNYKITIKSTC